MIFRSQNKQNIFNFGGGCTLGVDDWGDSYVLIGYAGSSAKGTLLGRYDDEDCAVLALEKMYDAIGGEECKMDTPDAISIMKEVMSIQAELKRRAKADQHRAEVEERRKNETPLKAIAPYCWDMRGSNYTHLEEYGYATIEEVERASDEELLKVRGIGPKALGKLRGSIAEYWEAHGRGKESESND